MKMSRKTAGTAALVLVLSLSGCGSDTEDQEDLTEASAAPSGGPPGGFDSTQLEEITECLESAGLEDKMPEMPTDMPTEMPSEMPTEMPSEMPSDFPGGGMAGLQDDPEVQEALDACGIELPERPEDPQ